MLLFSLVGSIFAMVFGFFALIAIVCACLTICCLYMINDPNPQQTYNCGVLIYGSTSVVAGIISAISFFPAKFVLGDEWWTWRVWRFCFFNGLFMSFCAFCGWLMNH